MQIFNRDHRQSKTFLPGTRRSRTPADTLKDYGRFMTEVGITRLANVTGLDSIGIPVIQAVRPNSRALSVSQGKGADVDSAKVSALMESIELWHAERIESPLRSATYDGLRALEPVVDIFKLSRSAGAEIRADAQRTWIKGWDVLQQEPVWVPYEVVNMNTLGVSASTSTFSCNSNGLASGNHILEAIEHALCEVIERDTHAVYWARGLEAALGTKIDPTTIDDPSLRALLNACFGAQMEVAMVGREGMVGSSIVLGAKTSAQHAIVQGAGIAWRTAAELFSDYVEREPVLRKTLTTYIHVQMAQMAQTAACAHFHILQKRLATWLLMTQDRSRERSFLLTHEFMGYMLGVRRAGVTEALRYLEDRGLISYQRGRIEVLDMQGLKNSSCGCYVVERKILESTLGK